MEPSTSAAPARDPVGLAEWLHRRTALGAARPAVSDASGTWTYAELEDRAARLAAVLAAGGVRRGDRVAYLGFNHPMIVAGLFAAARIGAIFVPLNFRLTPRELEFIISDAGIHTVIAAEPHAATVDAIRAALPCKRFLHLDPAPAGWEALEPLMDAADAQPTIAPVAASDVAVLMYTSGTTGRPKGAMITHGNIWASNLNWVLGNDFGSHDVGLTVAPLFHVGGLFIAVVPVLFTGGHAVIQKQFEPAEFLRAVETYRVTVAFAVPAMMLFASQHEDFEKRDLSSIRLVIAGGAPSPESLLRRYAERGIPVSHCYGMTESTCAAAILETDNALAKLGSCGRSGMMNELRLIDGEGRVVTEPDVKGEVCIRGANVISGYWNMPEATAQAIDADGWLKSGDVGTFDGDGFLYVCDRVKDMIISGGENVYPAEIESAIYEHPAVREAAVIGAPDERWGERVVAVVALKEGATLSLEELQTFARQRLAGYKIPRELRLVDALPRNSNGKVVKTELRAAPTERSR